MGLRGWTCELRVEKAHTGLWAGGCVLCETGSVLEPACRHRCLSNMPSPRQNIISNWLLLWLHTFHRQKIIAMVMHIRNRRTEQVISSWSSTTEIPPVMTAKGAFRRRVLV